MCVGPVHASISITIRAKKKKEKKGKKKLFFSSGGWATSNPKETCAEKENRAKGRAIQMFHESGRKKIMRNMRAITVAIVYISIYIASSNSSYSIH